MINTVKMAAISCLQINLNHSKLAQDCVANKIKVFNTKQNNFIICVQEPYIFRQRHARKTKIMQYLLYTGKSKDSDIHIKPIKCMVYRVSVNQRLYGHSSKSKI